MGKYLVTCSIVILFILFHIDIVSLSRSGSSRSGGGGKRGSHHKPSRPVHQPGKPSRPVHQPGKPSRPVHQPSKPSRPVHQPIKPVQQPSRPVHKPVKPAESPVKPVQEVPVQSARQPVQPAQNPALPQNNPVKPPQNPAYPPHNPANPPAQNPAYPPHNPANPPAQNPAYPPHNPANPPAQNPAYPPHNPANPPAQNPAYPPHNPANPPAQNPAYPPHNPANPAYPPHNPANPPYPPHNPANPAYPPHNPANPVYPPHNPANPAYPPHNPVNPAQNPVYPPQNPGYPQHNPAYPPQNPGYPQHNPGYPHNPNYPQNPGYPHHNPGYPHNPNYPHNPSWGQHDVKPWKPKPPKTNLKYMAGAAVAGAFGGFLLGHAMSQMHFRFPNPEEERWWYANRDRYPAQVYYPKYEKPVPEDIFVKDCWNMTVREFVEPSGNETADEMEARVVTRVVHEMCIEQYRTFSGHAGGGSVIHTNSDPQKPNPAKPVMTHVQAEAATGTAVENSGAILGSPMANMTFHFNESEEEQWWNENRHRFIDHVFHPNYNHPVSLDVFVSDCVNITMGAYLKPSGNETASETETRVLKRLVPEMCTELYHNYSRQRERDGFGKSDNKPEESIMPVKLAIKDMAVAPSKSTVAKGSGDYIPGSAVSNMIFHFKDGLLLTSPSILWVIALSTLLQIP